jgi:hypothetical protein
MPPPEVWGPTVWSLFHTLAEKVNANIYPYIAKQLFNLIVRICRFLPCPECSTDASNFLAKIKIENLKTKDDFKQMFYLFHNYVNAKKRKPLFNFSNLVIYQRYRLVPIVNNFILCYNTKGNMKLLNESFQRQFVLKDFRNWFSANIKAFYTPVNPPTNIVSIPPCDEVEEVSEEPVVVSEEEPVVEVEEEPVVEEVIVAEEPVVEEQIVVEESVVEEPVVEEYAVEEQIVVEESVVEESAVEEQIVVEESFVEESVVEESVVDEPSEESAVEDPPVTIEDELVVSETVVSTKSKKNKKKKKN